MSATAAVLSNIEPKSCVACGSPSRPNGCTARPRGVENTAYDLKAVNPNKKPVVDTRTPQALLDIIEVDGWERDHALAELRSSL